MYRYEALCVLAVRSKSRARFMVEWLQKVEKVKGDIRYLGGYSWNVFLRYRYEGTFRLRSCLRRISLEVPDSVITGQFAEVAYMQAKGIQIFSNEPIEVFVLSSDSLTHVRRIIKWTLTRPMRLKYGYFMSVHGPTLAQNANHESTDLQRMESQEVPCFLRFHAL